VINLKKCFTFSVFCLLAFPLYSQRNEEDVEPVHMRFLFLDESRSSYYILKNDNLIKISSYPYAISSSVEALSGSVLDVFKEVPRPPEVPEPTPIPGQNEPKPYVIKIAEVVYPSDTTATLAVLKPAQNESRFRVQYYESDPDEFPAGSVRVLNLGRTTFGVRMNEKLARVKSGESEVIFPVPDKKHRLRTQVVELQQDGGWKRIYHGITSMRPGQRINAVLVYSPSGMKHTFTPEELAEFGDPPPGHQWLVYKDKPQNREN